MILGEIMNKKLPPFDERGCLPEGIYEPTVGEFVERFVNINDRRKELFEKYQEFTHLCNEAQGIDSHYVDGSYVRNKENPGDIDLLMTFNDDVYNTEETYNQYFEITQDTKKMKDDYEVHVFFAKNTTDNDPVDLQIFWKNEKNRILDWWSRFYIDGENNIIDNKKKGFIVFDKEKLQHIEDWEYEH